MLDQLNFAYVISFFNDIIHVEKINIYSKISIVDDTIPELTLLLKLFHFPFFSFAVVWNLALCHKPHFISFYLFIFLFIFDNLFKVDKFTKILYTYIHKSSQKNWLIKVNYPIIQKNLVIFLIKTKEKENKNSKTSLWCIIKSITQNQPEKHTFGIGDKDSLSVSISS